MIKINVITAINNSNLNNRLRDEKDIIIKANDINNKEKLLEYVSENKNIDLIIINQKLPGNIDEENLIKQIQLKIRNIKIMYILENQNKNIENVLRNNNISDIFYNDEISIDKIIELIKNKVNQIEEKKYKIENEKNRIYEINEKTENYNFIYDKKNLINNKNTTSNINYFSNNNLKNENVKKNNNLFKEEKNYHNNIFEKINLIKKLLINKKINNIENKIITIAGPPNTGKTTFSINIAKTIKNKKTLIIDYDLKKQNIHSFYGIEKYSKKLKSAIKEYNNHIEEYMLNIINNCNKYISNKNIENNNYEEKLNYYNELENLISYFLIKINNDNYIISGLDIVKNIINKNINYEKIIEELFKYLKMNFDFIIIDIGYENEKIINKLIIKNSNLNLVLIEPNIVSLNKFKDYIEENNYLETINVIINKKDKYSIDKNILKNIFDFNILGEIKYNQIYSNLINKNYKLNINNKYKKDYKKIINNF